MKKITSTILLIIFFNKSFAQNNSKSFNYDSLKTELSKAKTDTSKILIYEKLMWVAPSKKEAIKLGLQGLRIAKRLRYDKGSILCGNGVGFLLVESDFYSAIPILMESKQLCERTNNKIELARALGFLGYAYDKFDNKKALSYSFLAKNLMEKERISENIIPINASIGFAYKNNNNLDSALIFLKKGYQFALKSNKSPIKSIDFYRHFGEVYYKRGQKDSAMHYFRKALFAESEQVEGGTYLGIAQIFRDKNQLDSAKFYAQKSLEIHHNSNELIEVSKAANLLFELYKNSNTNKALNYHLLASAAKDSIYNQEKVRQVEKLAYTEREMEARTQRRIEAHQTELDNTIKMYSLLGILGIFSVILFFLYRNNKIKQKANNLLHDQKEEIDIQRSKAEKALLELKAAQNQLIHSEKLASLGELTAGIAHEIQNPLNFVNNFSSLNSELVDELNEELDKGNIEDIKAIANDIKANSEKISTHGHRASSIVKGMLDHSRTSSGEKEPTDINALADEYLRLTYHGLRAKDNSFNADFKVDLDPNLPKINVIPQEIGRVLLNLINNAFQSPLSPDGGTKKVIISTRRLSEAEVEIRVKDNGSGIPDSIKSKIFQPFFTTKPTGEGTGLGLSLAYDIITKGHGGTLEVVSEEGNGAEFIIKLNV